MEDLDLPNVLRENLSKYSVRLQDPAIPDLAVSDLLSIWDFLNTFR
jgi:hypothetical protein